MFPGGVLRVATQPVLGPAWSTGALSWVSAGAGAPLDGGRERSRQTGTMEVGEGFGPWSPEDQLTGLGPQNDSLSSAVRLLAMTSGSPHRVPLVYRCFSCVQPRLAPPEFQLQCQF